MADGGTIQPIRGGVHRGIEHESARKHVTGAAAYTDDIPELPGTLHVAVRLSDRAHARILGMDLSRAKQATGVHAVFTYADVPGDGDIGTIQRGDPVLADDVVEYAGQAVVAVAAETLLQARAAARLVEVYYDDLPAVLTAEAALEKGSFVSPPLSFRRGDAAAEVAGAPNRLTGTLEVGGQDHFYLEGHIAYAIPKEDGDLLVHSSTQHPAEVQHAVAQVLGRPMHGIAVECRRMGGGFGGKESQPAQIAAIAALLANATKRPVKFRLDRDDDMLMTGKRHDFFVRYDVGFDGEGRIRGLEMDLAGRCGMSLDLSNGVVDRAMFHADNAYYLPTARVTGHRCKTNTVSNTAFRGFGGPQGVIAIEHVVDEIARALGKDPLDVRRVNLYGGPGRETTHYWMPVEEPEILAELMDRIERDGDYRRRREEIDAFNARSPVLKKGLAVTPVKFGISFTVKHLNQAAALVHVYLDGSVQVNHGGTEMGQGIHTKMAQIAAQEFQIDVDRVRVTASATDKVPNAPPTAASAGTDLNGMAVRIAVRTIRDRLVAFLAQHCHTTPDKVEFRDNAVFAGNHAMSFAEVAKLAYLNRVSLSSTGHYATPKIWWDREKCEGRPFFYFSCGVAVTEALIDTLTGEYTFPRADVLHDCSGSINPAIDLGQVEGAFVQGLGWVTSEELWWDGQGRLRTHAPSTYKIPTSRSLPKDFRVALYTDRPNREDTVFRSKAIGEPPLMLGISAWLALKDAVAAVGGHRLPVRLDAPATPERVLLAVEDVKAQGSKARMGSTGG
ncbi:xanthine dehydrogenase molybdopterin binding subunit [Roseomonas genomospecies 6]|uniref:Xanthine dehydrogenase molybdopterin binding subunit n=1 Tax=Roseomonas genomospecies 6 TaxID=214106 RepID=A0A9W7NFW2_9PROT|nr:xanthine dehydrogenase molybdopterin binding subunit [Roseomonas genomospecies 6]KAA0678132.1 xanthine dehydrogenase molybdopterin binding subunit [Roseomonas genomospecies 6]